MKTKFRCKYCNEKFDNNITLFNHAISCNPIKKKLWNGHIRNKKLDRKKEIIQVIDYSKK